MTVRTRIGTRSAGVPAWAAWMTVFLFLVGGVYLASNLSGTNPSLVGIVPGASGSAAPSGGANPGVALAIIKKAGCQACHGQDLTGSGAFPNLHGLQNGPTVANLQQLGKAHPDNWMELWIGGTDPAVKGIDRKSMPAFDGQLSKQEIATVVAYLKTLK
ncbi:MAG: cytochrome c [Chloroflexota bacterium]|nr:cytochrome c [Chloroflexota bacterium]